jgi:hypothetical protein
MEKIEKITKKQLVRMISELEKSPNDKVRILGQTGITLVGAGLGAAAAGTIAGMAGATSIWGATTLAGWAGVTVAAATPVGWVVGCAAAAGALVYGVSRIIRGGTLSEGRKLELLRKYREELRHINVRETAGSITDSDRTRFICSMRELIDKELLAPQMAFRLIEQVEGGAIPISRAIGLIEDILVNSLKT